MKTFIAAAVGLCLLTHGALADDNAIKNGDFTKGKMGWKMEPGIRVIDVPEEANQVNRVVEVTVDKKTARTISLRFDIKSKTKALKIQLRLKPGSDFVSATPEGDQLTFRVTRPDGGSTFSGRKIERKEEWQELTWDFSSFERARNFTFSVEFHPGTGTIQMDDVVIKEM